jgi:hypothetical protein
MNAKIIWAIFFVAIFGICGYYLFGNKNFSKVEAHQANVNFCMNHPLNSRCGN